jgi:hypothetical protein
MNDCGEFCLLEVVGYPAVNITSAACRLVLPVRTVGQLPLVFFGIESAAARGAVTAKQAVDNGCSATDTCLHRHCLRRAVLSAGSTFHARITIIDSSMAVIQTEHTMGAYQSAHATADTSLHIKLQSDHILKVDESSQ